LNYETLPRQMVERNGNGCEGERCVVRNADIYIGVLLIMIKVY